MLRSRRRGCVIVATLMRMETRKTSAPKKKELETAELRAFKETSSVFHDIFSQPGLSTPLAWKLYQGGVISRPVRDDITNVMLSDSQRADKLLSAIEKAISANSQHYRTVYKLFSELEDAVLRDTAEQMDDTYWNIHASYSKRASNNLLPWDEQGLKAKQPDWQRYCCCVVSVVLVAVVMFMAGLGVAYLLQPQSETERRGPSPQTDPQFDSTTTVVGLLDHTRLFESVDYDLPNASEPFVGRERKLTKIVSDLRDQSISIVGIHGPPAFGKSTLAIHVGHRLVSAKISVRYINVNEFSLFKAQLSGKYDSSGDLQEYEYGELAFVSLNEGTRVEIQLSKLRNSKHLLKWARDVRQLTVLILDNCDNVIHKAQEEFQTLVEELVELSSHKLKVVITSQQSLMFLDHSVAHNATELSPNAAEMLLTSLTNKLTSTEAKNLSKLVGYCPLTLKVAAKLLEQKSAYTPSILMKTLGEDLKPVVANKQFPEKDRFMVIMDFAFQRLPFDLQEFLYIVSFYPGSFSSEAVQNITSRSQLLPELVDRSLLEEYFYKSTLRYTMNSLIKNYFQRSKRTFFHDLRERGTSIHLIHSHFLGEFRKYYSTLTVQYAQLLTQGNMIAAKELMETERHNFDYLVNLIITSQVRYISEVVVIIVAYSEKVFVSDYRVSLYLLDLMSSRETFTYACNIVGNTVCLTVYAKLTEECTPFSIPSSCSFTALLKAKSLEVHGMKEGNTLHNETIKFLETIGYDDCMCKLGLVIIRVTCLVSLLMTFFVNVPYIVSETHGSRSYFRFSLLSLLLFLQMAFWIRIFFILLDYKLKFRTMYAIRFQVFGLVLVHTPLLMNAFSRITRILLYIIPRRYYDRLLFMKCDSPQSIQESQPLSSWKTLYLSYCLSNCCSATFCTVFLHLESIVPLICWFFTDYFLIFVLFIALLTAAVDVCLFFIVTVLIDYNRFTFYLPSLSVVLTNLHYYISLSDHIYLYGSIDEVFDMYLFAFFYVYLVNKISF